MTSMVTPEEPTPAAPPAGRWSAFRRRRSFRSWGLAISQITAQVCDRSIGRPLEVERGHEPAGFVHQIDDGRVVHGVTTRVERNLFEIDPVSLCDCRDRGRISGQTRKVWIETRQIILDRRGRIALGIDRDK